MNVLLDDLTPAGRNALRRWYRHYRTYAQLDRRAAREVIEGMKYASIMGPLWRRP